MPSSTTVCAEPGCPNLTPCTAHKRADTAPHRSPSSRRTGRRDWTKTRVRILRRDKHKCQWCGRPATEVDHLTPVAYGGGDRDGNLNAACTACNQARNRRAAPTGLHLIATIGAPGSGKTTWAHAQPHRVLSLDDLRPAGDWTFEKHRIGLTRLIREAVKHGDARAGTLIIDTTASSAALRGAVRHTAHRIGYELHGVLFHADTHELLARNRARPRPVPEEHLLRMATQLVREGDEIRAEQWASLTHADNRQRDRT